MRHHYRIKVSTDDWIRSSAHNHPLPPTMVQTFHLPLDENAIIFSGWHEGTPEDFAEIGRIMEVARGDR